MACLVQAFGCALNHFDGVTEHCITLVAFRVDACNAFAAQDLIDLMASNGSAQPRDCFVGDFVDEYAAASLDQVVDGGCFGLLGVGHVFSLKYVILRIIVFSKLI